MLATVVLVAVGMTTTVFGSSVLHKTTWALPNDLWGLMTAAQRLVHLQLSGLYTKPTGLISFPGAAVLMAPAVALMDALGVPVAVQAAGNPRPESWLFAGPYEIALSGVVLFAADAVAERLGVPPWRRFLLCVAQAVALWSVSVRWGHPEDAVATGLLLYAVLALSRSRLARAGWLAGAAVAVQPLVLLAVPVLLAAAGWSEAGQREVGQGEAGQGEAGQGEAGPDRGAARRVAGFAVRTAAPSLVLLSAAAAANWSATWRAVTSQPNFPQIDHPTPWTSLAPHLDGGSVAAGPGRVLAIAFACGCGAAFWYQWRIRRDWVLLLWWAAFALAMRSVFESVMVAYYVWPVLALALAAASARARTLLPASAAAVAVTFASQLSWRGPWGWWTLMMAGLALTLLAAWPPAGRAGEQALLEGATLKGAIRLLFRLG